MYLRIRTRVRLLALAALLAVAGASSADVVHLRGGRRLVGRVEETPDSVRVSVDGGTLTIPRSQVERIERGELPGDEFARRFASLGDDDVAAALDLAAFAEHAGLPDEAGRALGRVAVRGATDPKLRQALRRWSVDVRRLAPDPEGDARLCAVVGSGAKLHVTPHFRIAFDVDPEEARRRGDALEAAYRKVYDFAARIEFDAKALEKRVDVVLFADHARWVAALHKTPEELKGMSGLYVHADARVYLFDTTTIPEFRAALAAVDGARAELAKAEQVADDCRTRVATAAERVAAAVSSSDAASRRAREADVAHARELLRAADAEHAAARRRIEEYEGEVAAHTERENLATTTHEACHALSFATGICRGGQPMWFLEGLATLFEVTNRTTFLIDAPNRMRVDDLQKGWSGAAHSALAAVVADARFADPKGDRLLAYAEAWSLAWFLCRRHPEGLAKFARDGRLAAVDQRAAEARLEDFRAAFGTDLASIEAEWLADVRSLLP
ncbi:MAG: DUF1570 domain-containing protein [Planctomycetes bacterium]|nr:DUF1570 domain-containing protein [Planctomycetota bacterium]